jgi:hypothetical protein
MAIFESAVILEYLEDTRSPPLHPADPLDRADHRAWTEVSSSILNDIAGFYAAATPDAFAAKTKALEEKFGNLEGGLSEGPYFAGSRFSLVTPPSRPSFAISTSSTRSQTLESWRASQRRPNGGRLCASAPPFSSQRPPTMPRVCAPSCWRATPGYRSSCRSPLRTAAHRTSAPKGPVDA